jgi:hypothetical protein
MRTETHFDSIQMQMLKPHVPFPFLNHRGLGLSPIFSVYKVLHHWAEWSVWGVSSNQNLK